MAANLGKKYQVNPLIYITKENRDFKHILESYWNNGKKNDVILILGINDNYDILWSDVICYSKNNDIYVDATKYFTDKKLNLKDNQKIIFDNFKKLIINDYKRKPMKEFSYLKENITLDWYWQLIIIILNILISSFIIYN